MKNIRRLQDIQINNVDIIETYKEIFNNESIEEAHNLINTDTLKSYVLQSEWMNDVKTKIEQVEEHKDTECDKNLADRTEEFQFNINELIYIGEYSSSKQYYKNNFVFYNEEIYFCIENSLNKDPTDVNYWVKIGLRGEKGQYDMGVVWRGIWDYSTEYYKYDLVSYNNNLYIAKRNNIHSDPTSSVGSNLFLNNSLYLNNTTYLNNNETNNDWFLLTKDKYVLQIYDSPEDYTQLPIYSIFFQKL